MVGVQLVPELLDLGGDRDDGDRAVLVLSHGSVRSTPLGLMMLPGWLEADVRLEWNRPPAGDDEREILARVAVLLDRICPAMPCYVAPALRRPCGERLGGFQHNGGALLLAVSRGMRPWDIYHMAMHEAWHAAELRLSPGDFALVRQAVQHGAWLPQDGYNDSAIERAANAFASWACAMLSVSACPAAPAWSSVRSVEQVFGEVLAGVYGKQEADKPSLMSLFAGDVWWLAGRAWTLVRSIARSK